jgi:hypothetical protein
MRFLGQDYDYNNNDGNNGQEGEGGEEETPDGGNDETEDTTEEPEQPEHVSEQPVSIPVTPVYKSPKPRGQGSYRPSGFGSVRQSSVQNPGVEYDEIIDKNAPIATPPPKIPLKNKVPNSKFKSNSVSTPVTGLQYRPQPQQPYITPQPVSGKN